MHDLAKASHPSLNHAIPKGQDSFHLLMNPSFLMKFWLNPRFWWAQDVWNNKKHYVHMGFWGDMQRFIMLDKWYKLFHL